MTLTWETRQQWKKFDKRIIHVDRRWLVNITLYIVILEDVAPVTIRDTGLPLTYIRCLSRYSGMIREDDHVLTIKVFGGWQLGLLPVLSWCPAAWCVCWRDYVRDWPGESEDMVAQQSDTNWASTSPAVGTPRVHISSCPPSERSRQTQATEKLHHQSAVWAIHFIVWLGQGIWLKNSRGKRRRS